MTKEEAEKIHSGSIVVYKGERCRVGAIKTSGIAAPHFALSTLGEKDFKELSTGKVSYTLCSLPKEGDTQ